MDSLYAGRPGSPFIVRARFDSIDDMKTAFAKGPDYTDVWYGEYCLIDTPNKNDPDNGKLYQRDADYSGDDNGAQYIGQIVGPSSGTPFMSIGTIADVKKQASRKLDTSLYEERAFATDAKGTIHYDNDNSDITNGTHSASPYVSTYTQASGALVPGKSGTTYNDGIQYGWVNISRALNDDDSKASNSKKSWTYLGFTFPYPVFEFTAKSISAYASPTVTKTSDETKHPYYWAYLLGIPKGIKGDSLHNLRVITYTTAMAGKIYNFSDFTVNSSTGVVTKTSNASYAPSGSKAITSTTGPEIMVVDMVLYDKSATGNTYTLYVGDYNVMESVKLEKGKFTAKFTYDPDYTASVNYVSGVKFDKTSGDFTKTFADGTTSTDADILEIPTKGNVATDGTLTFTMNTGTTMSVYDSTGKSAFKLRYPTAANVPTDILADKKLTLTWNNSPTSTTVSGTINSIVDVTLREDDYHLLVLFSDPSARITKAQATTAGIGTGNEVTIDGVTWVRNVKTISGIVTSSNASSVFWRDYGAMKDASGILIGGNVTSSDVGSSTTSSIITYLNKTYSDGYSGGKIMTFGEDEKSKKLFAYDYDNKTWYYLGSIGEGSGGSASGAALIFPDSSGNYDEADYDELPTDAVVIKATTKSPESSGPSKFWLVTSS